MWNECHTTQLSGCDDRYSEKKEHSRNIFYLKIVHIEKVFELKNKSICPWPQLNFLSTTEQKTEGLSL